jgi:hypothetical protein
MEPSRGKSICVPCESEAHYEACVADPERFRQHLEARHAEHPELFPQRFAEGCGFQDKRWSIKQQIWTRRHRGEHGQRARQAPRARARRRETHPCAGAGGLCADHRRRRLPPGGHCDRFGLGRCAGGRVRGICPGGTRAFAHLQPQDGLHRRLGRHAERLAAPLPDGVHPLGLPALRPQDR